MAWDNSTQEFEAKIEHRSQKAFLIEMTLGGRYWLPISQVVNFYACDADDNFYFEVKNWWWNKREDFDADKPRE